MAKSKRKGRMPAGLRRYWASRRAGGKRKVSKRRRARVVASVAPRRRRRKNPIRHRARARRRNPIFRARRRAHRGRNPFNVSGIKAALIPAGIGALGAIGLSAAMSFVTPKLPASLQSGYVNTAVKLAGAIALGMIAGKVLGSEKGKYVTMGGLTVVLVGALTPLIQSAVPSLPLSGLGAYMQPGMSGLGRLGYYSPAAVIQPKSSGMGRLGAYMNKGAGLSDLSGGSGFNGLSDGM